MKNLIYRLIVIACVLFYGASAHAICAPNQIDVANDGTNCIDTKFSVTTTNLVLPDDFEFKFNISAVGTFYVDCGTDGTLTSNATDVSGKTIVRDDINMVLYTCSYVSGGTKTIRFAGTATRYDNLPNAYNNTTIEFYTDATPQLLLSIDGRLTDIFPQISTTVAGTPSFQQTFYACTNLNNIPAGLFANIRITSRQRMFGQTFSGCTSLTAIPHNLFVNVTGNTYWTFERMFAFCSSLTDIPSDLFDNIPGAPYSFYQIFSHCKSLTSLPNGLFANVKTGEATMFQLAFWNCTNLVGYIPPSMFSGLITNGSPTANNMWNSTFQGTKLDKSCPTGTTQFITGYEDYWDGRVSCVPTEQVCDAGAYLPQHWYQCELCPINNYCIGGTYTFNETTDQGIQSCASGTFSPTGSAVCYPHILHVGDSNVYLKSTKQTTPSFNVKIGNDIFYANMTTVPTKMNKDSSRYFRAQWDNNSYYICDDTTCGE